MAMAVKEQRAVRGESRLPMRPDGSRKAFTPYPTPLFDKDGDLMGAVNMLIDISEEQAGALAEQATRCRRLADAICDRYTTDLLRAWPTAMSATPPRCAAIASPSRLDFVRLKHAPLADPY